MNRQNGPVMIYHVKSTPPTCFFSARNQRSTKKRTNNIIKGQYPSRIYNLIAEYPETEQIDAVLVITKSIFF